jgi:DNA-binding protein Fis
MQNDIEMLNSMLYQSLKQEIENLRDNAIYIPFVAVVYDVKIDKSVEVEIESIQPEIEYRMLIEYIATALSEKLREEIKKSIREDYYKIVKEQVYIPPHLKMVQEFDMVVVDKAGMMIGNMRGSLYAPKDTQKLPKTIIKAMKSYINSMYSTIKEAMRKIVI